VPLNSVQQYVKGVMDGLMLPSTPVPLAAYITPPDPGDGTQPAVYIWGSTANEERQSMPRAQPGKPQTGGFKLIHHNLDLWLIWFGASDDPNADSAFPAVIDACTAVLRSTEIQVPITDPLTGQQSTILNIGESIKWDYMPVISVSDERWLRYDARLIVTVLELLQA
jgi:hypothetical protein